MFFIIIMIFGILIFPENALESGKIAINLCINSVIPSLFPFFVLQDMLIKLGFGELISKFFGKVFFKLFKCNSPAPFLLGIIGGYPVGAKAISSLYNSKKISKYEAEHLLSFCVNSGPAFIIGFAGSYIFKSAHIGYILAFSHILASIIVGIFMSFTIKSPQRNIMTLNQEKTQFHTALIESVNTGFNGILSVSGFVIFFNVLIEIFMCFNIFRTLSYISTPVLTFLGLSTNDFTSLIIGFFEMTNGLNYLVTSTSNMSILVFIASFILGFGGISVHFQTLNFCKGLSLHKYFTGKFLHGIISGFLSILTLKTTTKYIIAGNFSENLAKNNVLYYNFKFFAYFSAIVLFFYCVNLVAKLLKKVYNGRNTVK